MSAEAWTLMVLVVAFPGGGALVFMMFLDYLDYREHRAELKREGEST